MKYLIWVDGDQVLDKPLEYNLCKAWVDNYRMTQKKCNVSNFEEIYIIGDKYRLEVTDD
mgnify:CR=1 FL=1|tara:strand:- start:13 stop:189 length:177 start_codon:yes stop_codon:yes gene_type:complete